MSSSSSSTARVGGPDLSLERITVLLRCLGSPQDTFPVIHVAGTNAKGSTTAYLDALLTHAVGLRTGRFNSPHLIQERDACRVAGLPIDAKVWAQATEQVNQLDTLHCTPFEKLTARALLAFTLLATERRPQVLLVEVGLGGRLDATNVFSAQGVLASVLCPVDLDHEALLGHTLSAIATEKAAITKPGGLLVVADQRRGALQGLQEVQCDALRGANVEVPQVGQAAGEVLEAVRKLAFPLGARVVKSFIPWEVLQASPTLSNVNSCTTSPWSTYVDVSARHTPSLYPSTSNSPSYSGTYSARTGDSIVAGPSLRLPRTRAALAGALTALQTLWAIARDETPSGLGQNGSDPYEEVRLRIAWALRDDRDAAEAVRNALNAAKWQGRAEWKDISLPYVHEVQESARMEVDEPQAVEGEQDTSITTAPSAPLSPPPPPTTTTLHLLVDGAHNASAAQALRVYIDSCLTARLATLPAASAMRVSLTYILSFSQGKDVRCMLSHLLSSSSSSSSARGDNSNSNNSTGDLSVSLANVSLSSSLRTTLRVGLVDFSTPVQGMPWVTPAPLVDVEEAVRQVTSAVEVRSFAQGLQGALRWAAEIGDGRSVLQDGNEKQLSLVVLAGSLYLVGDLYRLAQAQSDVDN